MRVITNKMQLTFRTISGGVIGRWSRIQRRRASFMTRPVKLIINILDKAAHRGVEIASKACTIKNIKMRLYLIQRERH